MTVDPISATVLTLLVPLNSVGLVGMIYWSGRKVQELAELRAMVARLEGQNTDVMIARVEERLAGLSEQMQFLHRSLHRLSSHLAGKHLEMDDQG